jgi:hypothetical protein
MNETNPQSPSPAKPPAPTDLSSEILQIIEKRPADRVTCRWISGNNYRCNWWAPSGLMGYDNPGMVGLMVTTHRVRQSRFLTVTKTPEGLVFVDSQGRKTA